MTQMQVHIIKTGGTIEFLDSDYEHINKALLKLDTSIDAYLENVIKPHFRYMTVEAFSKDSRDINAHDRQNLVDLVNSSPCTDILITHGTVTMRETAEYIARYVSEDKKVILTGAMIPLVGFASLMQDLTSGMHWGRSKAWNQGFISQ